MRRALSARTRILALTLSIFMVIGSVACNVSQVQALIRELAPVVLSILQLAAAFGAPAVTQQQSDLINNSAKDAADLYGKFVNAEAASKPDAQARFDAAWGTFSGNLGQILSAVHVSNPAAQQKITALVSLAGVTISNIEFFVSVAENKPVATARAAAGPHDAGQLKSQFNKVMRADSGDATVDAVSGGLTLK